MEKERLIELVGSAQQGDKNALAELFYNYKDSVYFVAGKMLGSAEAAEEVVTDTTEVVLRKLETLDVPDGFFAWVRMIADSIIIKKLGGAFADALAAPVAPSTSVGDAAAITKEQFDTPEVLSLTASLVDTLPEDLKLCSYMFYHQRLAVENIAKVLGIDKNAATARLYAALNDIEAAAAEQETSAGVLTAAPAWLIASALHESSLRFTLGKERSFELLNIAAKAAYAPKPEPTNEEVIHREAGGEQFETEETAAAATKEENALAEEGTHGARDVDDDDDYDDDEEYEDDYEDDARPGFFSTIWGKILIIFLALAVVGAAAAIFLPKLLNKNAAAPDVPATSDQQVQPEADASTEPQTVDSAVTSDKLAATYYGYYTDAENKSGKVDNNMVLTVEGGWSSAGEDGTYVYDENTMKLTLTNSEGTATEWNCWLDGENIVLSQTASAGGAASTVYNYYQSETLRDQALATVDSAAA